MLVGEKASQSSEENEEGVKIFYSDNSVFIGARGGGGQFREHASIRPLRGLRRTRVHSDVPRVTFFY
jgi:hypothetical protein